MAAISSSIVHLTMRFNETNLSTGTGFIYQSGDYYYIVTAWHNLTGLHSELMIPLSKNGGIPNNLIASVAFYSNSHVARLPIIIPLVDTDKSLFMVHPKRWPRIDVAVIPFNPKSDYDLDFELDDNNKTRVPLSSIESALALCPIQQYLLPNKGLSQQWLSSVDVTEELFIPGYPLNIHDYYSQPVWKRATIASSVQRGWNSEPKFLIDTASKNGMSGSPVIFYNTNGTLKIRETTYLLSGQAAILAGVYVGRLGVSHEVDPQIGVVWHQSVIDEIINGCNFEYLSDELQLHTDELEIKAESAITQCEKHIDLPNINSDSSIYHYVYKKLMRDIDGRASPIRAEQAIRKIVASRVKSEPS